MYKCIQYCNMYNKKHNILVSLINELLIYYAIMLLLFSKTINFNLFNYKFKCISNINYSKITRRYHKVDESLAEQNKLWHSNLRKKLAIICIFLQPAPIHVISQFKKFRQPAGSVPIGKTLYKVLRGLFKFYGFSFSMVETCDT